MNGYGDGPDGQKPAVPPELEERLQRLGAKLAAERDQAGPRILLPGNTVQFASRAGSDLVAAVLIGIAFGAAIDAAFDTWPLAIVVLTLLGTVAAVRTSYRTARTMANDRTASPGGAGSRKQDGGPAAQSPEKPKG